MKVRVRHWREQEPVELDWEIHVEVIRQIHAECQSVTEFFKLSYRVPFSSLQSAETIQVSVNYSVG